MRKYLHTGKEIYKYFAGSYYEMQRENMLVVYKKYEISKYQEIIWLRELQDEVLLTLKNNSDRNENSRTLVGTFVRLINLDNVYQKEKVKEAMHCAIKLVNQELGGVNLLYYFRFFETSLRELENRWENVDFGELGITTKYLEEILKKILECYNNKDGWTEVYWGASFCFSIYDWRHIIFLDIEDCCRLYRKVLKC
ncbi:MAG: hypothetical protein ACRC6X_08905 [Culicoidibacterales bacterium]